MTGDHSCSRHGYCSDTDGSYECACQDGFEGDGVQCTNIDECELGLDKKLAVLSAEFNFTDNTTVTRFFHLHKKFTIAQNLHFAQTTSEDGIVNVGSVGLVMVLSANK